MKAKEGKDFLKFNDCYAKVTDKGSVLLFTMSEGFELTSKEFNDLVKFVEKQKVINEQQL